MSTPGARLIKFEKSTPVNRLFDAYKLRDFVSKYPRHNVRRPIRPRSDNQLGLNTMSIAERLRQGPIEYFKVYTRYIVPQIESRIEERLLE